MADRQANAVNVQRVRRAVYACRDSQADLALPL